MQNGTKSVCILFILFFSVGCGGQRHDIVAAGGSGENRIGEYDIVRPVGKGKFAVVYR